MVSRDLPGGNLNDPPKYTEDDYGKPHPYNRLTTTVLITCSKTPGTHIGILMRTHKTLCKGPGVVSSCCCIKERHWMWCIVDPCSGYGGRLVSRAELARLEELLRSFPTTHEEDARLLSGTGNFPRGKML